MLITAAPQTPTMLVRVHQPEVERTGHIRLLKANSIVAVRLREATIMSITIVSKVTTNHHHNTIVNSLSPEATPHLRPDHTVEGVMDIVVEGTVAVEAEVTVVVAATEAEVDMEADAKIHSSL